MVVRIKPGRVSALTMGMLMLSGQACAQPAETLNQAVEKAVLENPEVLAAWHRFQGAGEETAIGRSGWLPRVDLNAGYARERLDRPDFTSEREFERHGAALSVRQLIFDGFATSGEISRLGHEERARFHELVAISEETAQDVVRTYLDVLRYRQLSQFAKDNYETHLTITKQLEQRARAGVSKGVDLEQASGRLALAKSNWLTEQANLHDVSARYRRLVGELPADSLAPVESFAAKLPAEAALWQGSLAQAPALRAALAGTAAARASQDSAKSGYYPTLELRASEDLTRNQNGLTGESRSSAVEVAFSYNLFNGGADRARVSRAAHLLSQAQDLRDKACRDLSQTVSIAWNDGLRLNEQLDFLGQHELSTRKVRDAYRQQFDLGQRTLLDLLDTENELFDSRRAQANAGYDLELARARVLAPLGRLLPTLGLNGLAKNAPAEAGEAEVDASGCAQVAGSGAMPSGFSSGPALR
ncbi:MAG: TolC family outer membrane protein [Gammaproteobacteria bacterium]|nr:TolC family outer membrane protein [Gammaproteobacteria bacterium]